MASRAVDQFIAGAAPVLISGATGCYSESINGYYAPTREICLSGYPVYSKFGDASTCIVRIGMRWFCKSIDQMRVGISGDESYSAFHQISPSEILQAGPLVLGGALLLKYPAWCNASNATCMVSTGAEINRQVSNCCSRLFNLVNCPCLKLHLTRLLLF